jgi:NAD(P)-dependent dehydrogenase (short-subunit alcohol dehydrogenase family)
MSSPRQRLLIVGVRGLGRALALHFGARGFDVLCAARTAAEVEQLARDTAAVQPAGARALAQVADLGDAASLWRLCQRAWDELGGLDLVVAAQTGGAPFAVRPLLATPPEDVEQGLRGYPLATLRLLQVLGPRLADQGSGTFVQIGTGSGLRLRDGFAGLALPQQALRTVLQAAGRELRPRGVHCAFLAVEGQLDTPRSAAWIERHGRERAVPCAEVIRAIELLHGQDPRAWSFELALRPAASDPE